MRNLVIGNTMQYPKNEATCTFYIPHENGIALLPLTEENIRAIRFWSTSNGMKVTSTRKTSMVVQLSIHHINKLHQIKKTVRGLSIDAVFSL